MSDYHRAFEDGRHFHGFSGSLPANIFPTQQEQQEAQRRIEIRRRARRLLKAAGIEEVEVR